VLRGVRGPEHPRLERAQAALLGGGEALRARRCGRLGDARGAQDRDRERRGEERERAGEQGGGR